MKFELEQKLNEWRRELLAREEITGSDLDEMEDHLRDSWAALGAKGLSGEEAFLVARHRLGTAVELSHEFGKVNFSVLMTRRLVWMVGGFLTISFLLLTLRFLGSLPLVLAAFFPVDAITGAWMSIGMEAVVVLVLCGFVLADGAGMANSCERLLARFHGVSRGMRNLLAAMGCLLLAMGPVISNASTFFLVRLYSLEEMGQYYYRFSIYGLVKSVLIPCLLGVLLFNLIRRCQSHRVSRS